MSGICAVWRKENPEGIAKTLALISSGLPLLETDRVTRETDRNIGVAVSAGFDTQQIYQNERVLIACDADLQNEKELSVSAGHREHTPGDGKTAALLASLYERLGADCVGRLQGGFSLILWDKRERTLLTAVDGFGTHRLVYYHDDGVLLIASRIDALVKSGEIRTEVNPRAIARFLNFGVNLGPDTIFNGVQRLQPGTMLLAAEGSTRVKHYWDMRYGVKSGLDEAGLSQELEAVVERSVAAHCATGSFSEVGAYLSGGTDSSTVVGMMARMGRGPVKAFSIGYQEQRFNELEYARLVAKRFGAEHYTYEAGPDDCFNSLPGMIRSFDEPFGNASAIPTYFCARLAAQHGVKVLLAGDGGDELFGGNERYLTDKIYGLYQGVPRVVRKGLMEPILMRLPIESGLIGKARRYISRSNLPSVDRYFNYSFLCTHLPLEVFTGDFVEALAGYSILETPSRYFSQAPAGDHLDRLLYVDVKMTLGDSDLPKVTCMSDLAGIQTRFPFLDRSVAEFSGCIPAALKVKGFNKRHLFKRAFRNLLPVEVIKKKKHGFGIPVAVWLKSDRRLRELCSDTLLSTRAFQRGYFRREFIEELTRKFEADDTTYYGDTLWTFLVLELWHRQFVDAPCAMAL